MDDQVRSYPAPWGLKGKGYIFIYKFSKKFVEDCGNVPEFLKGSFAGGFGSIMVVNYESSDAGPYGELLFIPGKFRYDGKRLDNISKIYVSTMESVVNGRENWGIPKELADFSFETTGKNEETVTVKVGGKQAVKLVLKSGKLSFPVSTKLLPFPLVQRYEGKDFYTKFSGKGKGHFARVRCSEVDPELFPIAALRRPIAAIRVDPFDIVFPIPEIKTPQKP